jgi:N5-(cytidine 5'-diphosphoramidyl)-L-glutamine hydrolase
MRRVGITMREVNAEGYYENRDALAQDWFDYFEKEFPEYILVPIPNIGPKSISYFLNLSIDVLILSGGESYGTSKRRDNTELAMLELAVNTNTPVLGVCRGMQLIHIYFGGVIEVGDTEYAKNHVACHHQIQFMESTYEVNSYHSNRLKENTVDEKFTVLARSITDNSIEAFEYNNILGLMWHPERKMRNYSWSTQIVRTFLNKFYD